MIEKNKNYEMVDSEESEGFYWVGEFFKKKENSYLARVDDVFIEDNFNLVGLSKIIENLKRSYNAILDKGKSQDFIEESSLYYLIHQRYITSMTGLDDILEKVMNKEYGICPRIGCGTKLIPYGDSTDPHISGTKVFCYVCECLYTPKGPLKGLDGCAWGNSFPMFLIISFPYKFKRKSVTPFKPRLYGFRVIVQDMDESFDEE